MVFKNLYNKSKQQLLASGIKYLSSFIKQGGQIAYNSQVHKVIHDLDLALHETQGDKGMQQVGQYYNKQIVNTVKRRGQQLQNTIKRVKLNNFEREV